MHGTTVIIVQVRCGNGDRSVSQSVISYSNVACTCKDPWQGAAARRRAHWRMSGWVSPVSIGVGRSEEAAAEVARTEQDCAVRPWMDVGARTTPGRRTIGSFARGQGFSD